MKTYSLTGRILALVVGVSLASLLLHASMLFRWTRPLGGELVSRLSVQVLSAAAALKATGPARREQMAESLGTAGLVVSRRTPEGLEAGAGARAGAGAGADDRPPVLPPPLLEALGRALGDEVRIVAPASREHARLHFGMPIDGETWWIGLELQRPSLTSPLWPMFGTIALIALAAGIALWIGVRLITRPMSRLADAMRERRHSLRPIMEPASASRELRELIRSFNELVQALQQASATRRNLLAGVSHDLRTPLARLRLRAEMECPDSVLQRMEPDFDAVSHIVDQFLAYAQGQANMALGGAQPLVPLIRQLVTQYRDSGGDVHLSRCDAIDQSVPDVSIQRAVSNLIDNALHYGRGPVEVELREVAGGAEVMVLDHGQGISSEHFERALMPFVRLGDAQASAGKCGLGLAIVAQIAAQVQGRVLHHPFDGRRGGIGLLLPDRAPPIEP